MGTSLKNRDFGRFIFGLPVIPELCLTNTGLVNFHNFSIVDR